MSNWRFLHPEGGEKGKTIVWEENSLKNCAGTLWDVCKSDICSPDCTIDWHARQDNLIVQERLIDRAPKTSFICNKQHEYWLTHHGFVPRSSPPLIRSPHNLQNVMHEQTFMLSSYRTHMTPQTLKLQEGERGKKTKTKRRVNFETAP